MRRLLILAVALVAVFGMLAPPAMAQAPAPKVTITGFIDEVGTYAKNLSTYDLDYNRAKDVQAYGRTRGRFDIIGEVGKAKAVFGVELDAFYGQTGGADTFLTTVNNLTGAASAGGRQGAGANGGFDINTDTIGLFELKWLYTEFPLPIPLSNTVRLGAQPFGTVATDKLAVYANGDFPGVYFGLDLAPGAKLNLTYVQLEESLTGGKDGWQRGEDWAVIVSFGFSPFKGLDIKPMYSFLEAKGRTSGSTRQGRGGVDTTNAFVAGGFDGVGGITESRHTIGLDARFTAGPVTLQPTVLYQFGNRHNFIAAPAGLAAASVAPYGAVGTQVKADISAWLIDVRAGFNVGPLSIGLLGMYTTGDNAKTNPFKNVGYFQPLDTDTSYLADWGTQILSLGIDYFQILYNNAGGLNPGVAIGYDKYGRMQVGAKVAYAITPAFTIGAGVTPAWTAEKVDTDSTLVASAGLLPDFSNGRPKGDSRYLGTEINLSTTYRFAPGIAWDIAGGYMFAGDALQHARTVTCCGETGAQRGRGGKDGVDDIIIATSRIRFSF